MGKFEGKIAVITGGSSGIGFATAKRFVEAGAYVCIMGRRESEGSAAVQQIGRNVTGAQGDVSKLGDLERLFRRIQEEKGRLRLHRGNPGCFAPAGTGKRLIGEALAELLDEHTEPWGLKRFREMHPRIVAVMFHLAVPWDIGRGAIDPSLDVELLRNWKQCERLEDLARAC